MKQWLKQLRDDLRNKFFATPFIPTRLLKAHNRERSQNGVIKLRIHHELQFAAEEHAQWMSDNEIISHKGAYGLSIGDRTKMYSGITVGENIARGYSTVESVMQNWMDSNDNRSNILRKQYVDCGIAMAGRYWCVIFGTPIIICNKKDLLGFEYYKPTEHISDPIYINHDIANTL